MVQALAKVEQQWGKACPYYEAMPLMFVCETHREELGKLKGELHQLMGCTQFLSRAFRHLQCLNAVQSKPRLR